MARDLAPRERVALKQSETHSPCHEGSPRLEVAASRQVAVSLDRSPPLSTGRARGSCVTFPFPTSYFCCSPGVGLDTHIYGVRKKRMGELNVRVMRWLSKVSTVSFTASVSSATWQIRSLGVFVLLQLPPQAGGRRICCPHRLTGNPTQGNVPC